MEGGRKPYPLEASDGEWSLVAPYLTLQREDAGQREHSLARAVQRVAPYREDWRAVALMPNDLPPWAAVCQQPRRWLAAGRFEALIDDRRAALLEAGVCERMVHASTEGLERSGDGGEAPLAIGLRRPSRASPVGMKFTRIQASSTTNACTTSSMPGNKAETGELEGRIGRAAIHVEPEE